MILGECVVYREILFFQLDILILISSWLDTWKAEMFCLF